MFASNESQFKHMEAKMNYKIGSLFVASQLLTTSVCVDERTSSCDYSTRNDILGTFSTLSSIVQHRCSREPEAESQGCQATGEIMRCDLEEILTCMVPVRAKMLHPQTTSVGEVCGYVMGEL